MVGRTTLPPTSWTLRTIDGNLSSIVRTPAPTARTVGRIARSPAATSRRVWATAPTLPPTA